MADNLTVSVVDKDFYPDVKVGEEFTLPDGTPARKVGPEWREQAQAVLSTRFPGLNIVRDPVDGRFIIDDVEKFKAMLAAEKK